MKRKTKDTDQLKHVKLEVMIEPEGRDRIDFAAQRSGMNRSTFIRNAALKEADRVLGGTQK